MRAVAESNASRPEIYVVEIDGETRLVSEVFTDALKAGFELKQKFPQSRIKVHVADET
jgi:hypothetical protein